MSTGHGHGGHRGHGYGGHGHGHGGYGHGGHGHGGRGHGGHGHGLNIFPAEHKLGENIFKGEYFSVLNTCQR